MWSQVKCKLMICPNFSRVRVGQSWRACWCCTISACFLKPWINIIYQIIIGTQALRDFPPLETKRFLMKVGAWDKHVKCVKIVWDSLRALPGWFLAFSRLPKKRFTGSISKSNSLEYLPILEKQQMTVQPSNPYKVPLGEALQEGGNQTHQELLVLIFDHAQFHVGFCPYHFLQYETSQTC